VTICLTPILITSRVAIWCVCDNLFNPDPYYQQGGDMVRVGGLTYACEPGATMGNRITDCGWFDLRL